MVNYHALTSSLKLSGTNVVVLGGTQGIGAGIAIRFAELGSSVLVIGRNETAGNAVVNKMQSASADSSEARCTFIRADLGTVDGIRGAAYDIAAWAGAQGVDYLFQTQGTSIQPNIYLSADKVSCSQEDHQRVSGRLHTSPCQWHSTCRFSLTSSYRICSSHARCPSCVKGRRYATWDGLEKLVEPLTSTTSSEPRLSKVATLHLCRIFSAGSS